MSGSRHRWLGIGIVLVALPAIAADPPLPPTAPAVLEAPPAPPAADARTGAEVLASCTKLLEVGLWEEALEVSLPAIVTYPAYANSFEVVATIATDQLVRASSGPSVPPASAAYRPAEAPVVVYRSASGRTPRKKSGESAMRWGFDLGFPSGLRVEWHAARSVVSDVGFRAGGNVVFYDGVHVSSDITGFVDWRLAESWDLETSVGTVVYFGYAYAVIGAAAQYDPKGPMQVQLGVRATPYGMVVPEASVSFVW